MSDLNLTKALTKALTVRKVTRYMIMNGTNKDKDFLKVHKWWTLLIIISHILKDDLQDAGLAKVVRKSLTDSGEFVEITAEETGAAAFVLGKNFFEVEMPHAVKEMIEIMMDYFSEWRTTKIHNLSRLFGFYGLYRFNSDKEFPFKTRRVLYDIFGEDYAEFNLAYAIKNNLISQDQIPGRLKNPKKLKKLKKVPVAGYSLHDLKDQRSTRWYYLS